MSESNEEIEALLSLTDMSLDNQKKNLDDLNSLLADCTQDLYDSEIIFEDAELLEKLLFQFIFHNSSILSITDGITFNVRDKKLEVQDISAIYSLVRLQIDTFINLSYLFFIECGYPKNLRAYVYKIHGLRKQLSLNTKYTKEDERISKIRKELAVEIRKIRKTEDYIKSNHKQRNKMVNPDFAKLIKPSEVYSTLDFSDLSKLHSVYSNHIHAEYVGIRQLKASLKNSTELEKSIAGLVQTCSLITSSVLMNLDSNYTIQNGSFNNSSKGLKKMVETLYKVSKMN